MSILDRFYNNSNSLSQQTPLNQSINQVAQMRNLMQSINNSPNPIAFIQQLAQSNPQVNQALQLVQSNGGDTRSAAISYARNNGIDINALLNALGQR